MGGIWQCVVQGFGGVEIREGKLHIEPELPSGWNALTFCIDYEGTALEISASQDSVEICNLGEKEVTIISRNREEEIAAGENILIAGRD